MCYNRWFNQQHGSSISQVLQFLAEVVRTGQVYVYMLNNVDMTEWFFLYWCYILCNTWSYRTKVHADQAQLQLNKLISVLDNWYSTTDHIRTQCGANSFHFSPKFPRGDKPLTVTYENIAWQTASRSMSGDKRALIIKQNTQLGLLNKLLLSACRGFTVCLCAHTSVYVHRCECESRSRSLTLIISNNVIM